MIFEKGLSQLLILHNTNYAKCRSVKKAARTGPMKNIHDITSKERTEQLDVVRWVYAVAGLPADSPRFAWYVSRWRVPEKIAKAKAEGTFESAVSKCKPISPDWLRFAPAAIDAYREFIAPKTPTILPISANREFISIQTASVTLNLTSAFNRSINNGFAHASACSFTTSASSTSSSGIAIWNAYPFR